MNTLYLPLQPVWCKKPFMHEGRLVMLGEVIQPESLEHARGLVGGKFALPVVPDTCFVVHEPTGRVFLSQTFLESYAQRYDMFPSEAFEPWRLPIPHQNVSPSRENCLPCKGFTTQAGANRRF